MSPTQRSLKHLRDEGWTCEVVERWNPFARRRVDLFNFVDIFCASPIRGFLAVQTTTTANLSARHTKILEEPKAAIWLASGGQIWLMGWSKKGPRGKRKLWQLTTREITSRSKRLTLPNVLPSDTA